MTDAIPSFGSYGFSLQQKLILVAVRLGICRGKLRHLVEQLWFRTLQGDTPFDLRYRGIRLRLSFGDNTIERKILLSSKFREKAEIMAIVKSLSSASGSVFVDIGANIGYYSLMVAHHCPKSQIIAFEPNPRMYSRLHDNISLNGIGEHIKSLPVALGDKAGKAELKFFIGDLGGGSLNPNVNVKMADEKPKSVSVKQQTLKKSLQDCGVQKITALKIDVEGYEDKVLLPYLRATDTENWPHIIIIEDNQTDIWEENVLAFLQDNGYCPVAKTRGNLILQR